MMKYNFTFFISITLVFVYFSEARIIYEGSQVWKLTPKSEKELNAISEFIKMNNPYIDVWQPSSVVGRSVDILVSSDKLSSFRDELQQMEDFHVMIADVQGLVEDQQSDMRRRERVELRDLADFNYSRYHTPEEIQEWMDLVTEAFAPTVTQFQVGTTYEGRKINALKVQTDPAVSKRAIYVDGLTHAREWITGASILYAFAQILTDPDLAYMADVVDWYIVPMVNVDGYAHTFTGGIQERLWRKTRSKGVNLEGGNTCQGVDPNRNWDYPFAGPGSSPYPCDETYHGPVAFSESCVRHLSYFIEANKDYIDTLITVHSYGQYLLYPYNFDLTSKPANFELHDELGQQMYDAIKALYGTEFTFGQGGQTIYVCSGVTADWTAGVAGIPINWTIELRDQGEYGFLLPEDQIVPSGEEFLAALKVSVAHYQS